MGALLIALVGTIGVRITNSSRDQAGPPRYSLAAVESQKSPASDVVTVAPPLKSIAPSPEPGFGAVETVQQVTHERPSQAPPTADRYGVPSAAPANASPTPASEAPRFVAPGAP